jgi:hypothetical protein
MKDNELLNEISIPSPCPMDWNGMSGDDGVRYCDSCGKHVHDLAAMIPVEVRTLFETQGGDVCGRLTRMSEGAWLTAESPVGILPSRKPWQFNIRSLMGVIAGFATTMGIARLFSDDSSPPPPPPPKRPMIREFVGKAVYRPVRQAPTQTPGVDGSSGAPCR